MILDTATRFWGTHQARSFASLMDLYESNYLRLRKLIPDLQRVEECAISRASGAADLHLRVTERSRYTTTIALTYHFSECGRVLAEPDLTIRIYHDARQAELLVCRRRHGRAAKICMSETSLSQRWHMNRVLNKWLGFCLRQRHCFACCPEAAGISPESVDLLRRVLGCAGAAAADH